MTSETFHLTLKLLKYHEHRVYRSIFILVGDIVRPDTYITLLKQLQFQQFISRPVNYGAGLLANRFVVRSHISVTKTLVSLITGNTETNKYNFHKHKIRTGCAYLDFQFCGVKKGVIRIPRYNNIRAYQARPIAKKFTIYLEISENSVVPVLIQMSLEVSRNNS